MRIYINGLKSLHGENFVALGRKITFLVGPNSAGKSALLMALEKLSGEWIDRPFEPELVHTNPNRNGFIAGVQSLGVEWQHKKIKYGLFDSHSLLPLGEIERTNINLGEIYKSNLEYIKDEDEDDWSGPVVNYEQFYKNDAFVMLRQSLKKESSDVFWRIISKKPIKTIYSQIVLNILHLEPSAQTKIANIQEWVVDIFLNELKSAENEILLVDQPRLRANLEKHIEFLKELHKNQIASFEKALFVWWPRAVEMLGENLHGKEKQRFTNIFSKNIAILNKIERENISGFKESYPGKTFECSAVSADRSVPVESSLIGIIDQYSSDDMFQEIMASEINSTWMNAGDSSRNSEELIQVINRALRDDLFFDNGYQLAVSAQALVSRDEWEGNEIEKSEESRKFFCEISLRDSHGRKLGFKDVGSGIGYVLPVLTEIFRRRSNGKTVFLQQPELHLHPAMQANLTDVLIRAAKGKRIIAETHSEHLILRALKRIRQTSSKALKDPELELHPDDVAVNYFEPLGDGTTIIHNLRVSSDGDFIDRWPNGFFAERDGELFDE